MFAQAYQWTAGFSNYTAPVALIMGNLLLFQKSKIKPSFRYASAFAIALATQFFAEHITIMTALLSASALVCLYIKFKSVNLHMLSCFAGYASGAVIMFLNSAYSKSPLPGAHTMPQMPDMARNMVSNVANQITPLLVLDNIWAGLIISALLIQLLYASGRLASRAGKLLAAFYTLFCAYGAIRVIYAPQAMFLLIRAAEALLAMAFLASIAATAFFCMKPGPARGKLLFAWLAMLFANAPLSVVTPIGARCFYVSHVIYIVMIGILYGHLMDMGSLGFGKKPLMYAMSAVAACALAVYFTVYIQAARIYSERLGAIDAQLAAGSAEVVIRMIPMDNYVWQPNPHTDYLKLIYKTYYGIPQSVDVIVE